VKGEGRVGGEGGKWAEDDEEKEGKRGERRGKKTQGGGCRGCIIKEIGGEGGGGKKQEARWGEERVGV